MRCVIGQLFVCGCVVGLLTPGAWAAGTFSWDIVATGEAGAMDLTPHPPGTTEVTLGQWGIIKIEYYLEGWNPSYPGDGPLVQNYNCAPDLSTLTNGPASSLELAVIPCNENSDCGESNSCAVGGFCQLCEDSVYINENRVDWIYFNMATVAGSHCPTLQQGAAVLSAGGGADPGARVYLGTLFLQLSANACGDFTVAMDPAQTSASNTDTGELVTDESATLTIHSTGACGSACLANPCDANATCTDTLGGGFTCDCNSGYTGDGFTCADVDECQSSPCDANATCTNTLGSFTCACNSGYTGDGLTCADIDECLSNPCEPNVTCTNTPGGFTCASGAGTFSWEIVATGEAGAVDLTPVSPGTDVTLGPGGIIKTEYYFDGWNPNFPADGPLVEEYQVGPDLSTLTNGAGSSLWLAAIPCNQNSDCGEYNSCAVDGFCAACEDSVFIDEDRFDWIYYMRSPYFGGGDCNNLRLGAASWFPGKTTGAGDPGLRVYLGTLFLQLSDTACGDFVVGLDQVETYATDLVVEFDTDESATLTIHSTGACASECLSNPCDSNATCTDTPGSFTCTCNSGYTGDGFTCADVDECQSSPCDANANCTNTPGSYTCACDSGYTGDGFTCADIDECLSDPCDANATCTNTLGSFTCACNSGYTGDGLTCTTQVAPPLPEDALGVTTCTNDSQCTNEAYCVPDAAGGFPGTCYVPKNRYLSVAPNPTNDVPTARRLSVVTFARSCGGTGVAPCTSDAQCAGNPEGATCDDVRVGSQVIGWFGQPDADGYAGVVDEPNRHYATWSDLAFPIECGVDEMCRPNSHCDVGLGGSNTCKWSNGTEVTASVVQLSGCHISPKKRDVRPGVAENKAANYYLIEAILEGSLTTDPSNYSAPLELRTVVVWGDMTGGTQNNTALPPNNAAGFQDILDQVQRFKDKGKATTAWLDLHPQEPDRTVGFQDMLETVGGFKDQPYPWDDPCICAGLAPCN